MKNLFMISIIAIAMSAMVACGGSGNGGSGTNPQTTENSQTTDNGGAKSGNSSNRVVADVLNTVEQSIGVDFAKMIPDAFAIDGAIMSKKYTLYFVLPNKRNSNESNTEIEDFNKYLKSISADGKLYSDQELSTEFDGTIEDGVFERLFVKIGEKKWGVTVSYGETNYEYSDGKQYPHYAIWFEKK